MTCAADRADRTPPGGQPSVPPKWTIHYNIPGEYVGTGWEFFLDEDDASKRYEELLAMGMVASKRPFHTWDAKHLGAAHRWATGYKNLDTKEEE